VQPHQQPPPPTFAVWHGRPKTEPRWLGFGISTPNLLLRFAFANAHQRWQQQQRECKEQREWEKQQHCQQQHGRRRQHRPYCLLFYLVLDILYLNLFLALVQLARSTEHKLSDGGNRGGPFRDPRGPLATRHMTFSQMPTCRSVIISITCCSSTRLII
jgi:hypothetical protein